MRSVFSLSDFNQNQKVTTTFSTNSKIGNFTKISLVGISLSCGREDKGRRGEGSAGF